MSGKFNQQLPKLSSYILVNLCSLALTLTNIPSFLMWPPELRKLKLKPVLGKIYTQTSQSVLAPKSYNPESRLYITQIIYRHIFPSLFFPFSLIFFFPFNNNVQHSLGRKHVVEEWLEQNLKDLSSVPALTQTRGLNLFFLNKTKLGLVNRISSGVKRSMIYSKIMPFLLFSLQSSQNKNIFLLFTHIYIHTCFILTEQIT